MLTTAQPIVEIAKDTYEIEDRDQALAGIRAIDDQHQYYNLPAIDDFTCGRYYLSVIFYDSEFV